uniref:Interleukin-1 n=1 Tax=Crocodylus porosus TaxID=8502 RepID=A0A7M4F4I1_CROPO
MNLVESCFYCKKIPVSCFKQAPCPRNSVSLPQPGLTIPFSPDPCSAPWLMNLFCPVLTDAVSFTNSTITSRGASTYRYAYTKKLTIRDVDHKGFILQNVQAQAQLVALHLQGSNTSQEGNGTRSEPTMNKARVALLQSQAGKGNDASFPCNPIVWEWEDVPKLQLEEIKTEAQKRFLFFKIDAGDTFSFELAAHPGWFISTSKDDRQPLTSVNQTGQMAITNFFTYES